MAVMGHTHQLVQCRFFVHKNVSSFRGWCMLTLNGWKSNYEMEEKRSSFKVWSEGGFQFQQDRNQKELLTFEGMLVLVLRCA